MHIDVHAHIWPPEYIELRESYGETDIGLVRLWRSGTTDAEMEERFAAMDAAGIDLHVLSAAPFVPAYEDEAQAVEAARCINDCYAAIVAAHPDRFRGFALLPHPHADASLEEMDRAFSLGLVGVATSTTVMGKTLVEPWFEPVLAELDRRGSVLCVHPAGTGLCSPWLNDHGLTWMIGAPIEDTIAATHFITHGIPSRYPNLKIIVPHLGGALPLLLQRLDNQYEWAVPDTPELPSVAAKKMWYDTVAHCHVPALRCAVESLGADRLVMGTDYPVITGDWLQRAYNYVHDLGLSEDEAEGILGENARALFGFEANDAGR